MPADSPTPDLEAEIGQLFMAGFPGTEPSEGVLRLIREDKLGGVILFSRNIVSREQLRALCLELQMTARQAGHAQPLLIATDQENGLVRRLGPDSPIFPGNMALGAIGSEDVAYDVAYATGCELLALGVNMNLAPVVDVNNNSANPVIGIRSFGEDPELVARLGAAMARGYADAGVVSTLKHFPGHGDTAVDSHLAIPTVPASSERLRAVELVPFRRGIEAGADTVMVGHMRVPALESGEALPASISPAIVQSLLRAELGFSGVALADCLEMDAISRSVGTAEGAVRTLAAGIDLALVSHRLDRQVASVAAVREALAHGRLDPSRLSEAWARIWRLKQKRLSWETACAPPAGSYKPAESDSLRDRAYALSTTIARDDAHALPLRLSPEQRLLVLDWPVTDVTRAVDIPYSSEPLVAALRLRHDAVEVASLPEESDFTGIAGLRLRLRDAAAVIVVTVNAHLDAMRVSALRRALDGVEHVIGLAVCNPYDVDALPSISTYLLTYEYSAPALSAAAEIIFGARAATGRCPVTLTSVG